MRGRTTIVKKNFRLCSSGVTKFMNGVALCQNRITLTLMQIRYKPMYLRSS